jgi:hypothetical protein
MFNIEEIRLARALGIAIEAELLKGTVLPDEIMYAYKKLYDFWQVQINRELS